MISAGSAFGGKWEESFEGKFSKAYFVEPQAKGQGWNRRKINPDTGYSGKAGEMRIVEAPIRKGKGAMRCVNKDGKRMEFELVSRHEKGSPRLNDHCWAAISILMPPSDAPTGGFCIQWHGGVPNRAQGKEYARGPEAALRIKKKEMVYWSNSKASKSAKAGRERVTIVKNAKPGKWYDFMFHHFFSLKDNGVAEIWVNRRRVYAKRGCNAFYYRSTFSFKFGAYGSGSRGTLYFDEAKVETGVDLRKRAAGLRRLRPVKTLFCNSSVLARWPATPRATGNGSVPLLFPSAVLRASLSTGALTAERARPFVLSREKRR